MGYLKTVGTVIINIGLFLAVVTFLPGLPPDAEFSEYRIKTPDEVQIRLDFKNRLQDAEVLFAGEIKGPEYFAAYDGVLYTGIRGGYVVKIEENRIVPIVKFGKKCDGLWQEEKCGRPLGLQFNSKGELFVADTYYGIFKVNVNTRQYTNIVNSSIPIEEKIPKIVNSLDVAKNGDIYWTDSSSDFYLHDGTYTFLANPSGRLIRYNAATKKNEVLVKDLGFANGVLLSDDESFVIALESLTSRIIKYHLKGPKAGQHEYLIEGLPGVPDNVHSDGQGGFLVTLISYIDSEHPFLPHSLMPHPYLRKMYARVLQSIELPFKLLQDVYPNYYAERVLHSVGSFDMTRLLDTEKKSVVLRIDKNGNILDALHSEDRKAHDLSSAYIHNGYLWLGSPWNEYIMRVPLKQAFPDFDNKISSGVKVEKKEEPIVTVTGTPNIKVEVKPKKVKPTAQETTTSKSTTTPKPTTKPPSPTPKLNTQKSTTTTTTTTTSTTTTTTTTTPKPPSSPQPTPKASTQEIKKDSPKEIRKDDLKETKKEDSKSNVNIKTSTVKTESSKKSNEAKVNEKPDSPKKSNEATVNIKPESPKKSNEATVNTKSKSPEKSNEATVNAKLESPKKSNEATVNVKPEPSKKSNDAAVNKNSESLQKINEATVNPKSDKITKQNVQETQTEKAKTVEKNSDSNKK